jgi:hypothetical protein
MHVLQAWTRALNAADTAALDNLYADSVRYYGQVLTRSEVIERKRRALSKTPNFRQEVLGEPKVERAGDVTRVGFLKRSGVVNAQRDVFATLVLGNAPALRIVEETDLPTSDKSVNPGTAQFEAKNCSDAVWMLVESTQEARRLSAQIDETLRGFPASADLHAGGMGPIMPEEVGGDTYDVAVGVHHPERFEAYGWFVVDRAGTVTANAMGLDLDDAVVTTAPEALATFERLCQQH